MRIMMVALSVLIDLILAQSTYKGEEYKIARVPTEQEYNDMLFGWLIEAGVTSNSVLYVKDGVTVGIGTGEQDRSSVVVLGHTKRQRKSIDNIAIPNIRDRIVFSVLNIRAIYHFPFY